MKTMKDVKTITWSAKQINKMIGKDTIRFDSYVQRNKCWDNERKSKLIRSIINGFPRVPEIYATKDTEDGIYQCLDGQQRLTTVYDFVNDEIILSDLDVVIDENDIEYDLNGKKFSELPEDFQDVILSYSFRIAYYDDLTDDEQAELFYLINNSKPLTKIEHNRAVSKSLKTIQEIGKHELFTTSLTAKAFEKYTHEDLVIKSYIMLRLNTPCLDNKVVAPTMINTEFTDDDIKLLNSVYDRILNTYKTIISDDSVETGKISKRIAKRVITRTHMLSIMPIVKQSIEDGVSDKAFTSWVKNFFCGTKSATKYSDYNSRCTSGSGHVESIKTRLNVINKDYKNFMRNYKEQPKEEAKETKEEIDTVHTSVESVQTDVNESVEEVTHDVVEANEEVNMTSEMESDSLDDVDLKEILNDTDEPSIVDSIMEDMEHVI